MLQIKRLYSDDRPYQEALHIDEEMFEHILGFAKVSLLEYMVTHHLNEGREYWNDVNKIIEKLHKLIKEEERG